MSAHDETESGRDKYVQQWLSRVLRHDDSHAFEPSDAMVCHRAAREHRSTRSRDYIQRHRLHQRQVRESTCPELKAEEHRDKRLCAGRAESARSPPNGSYTIPDRLTLDTPFRNIEKYCHIQRPPTAPPAGQHPAAISSSPLAHIQRSKTRTTREHVDLTTHRESYSEAGMIPTSATPNMGKEYGRRPRHKTRPDRYEPKDTGKTSRKSTRDDKKKKSNPKKGHRRLSKAVIGEGFKAPNVKQNRLTLTTKPGPGLFRNGKASSPKRRRNLPDLSFSEMGFLAKRKDLESLSPRNKSSGKDISHYFSQQPPISKAHSADPDMIWAQRRHISSRSCTTPDVTQTAGLRAIRQSSSATKRHTRSRNSLTSSRAREGENGYSDVRCGNAGISQHDEHHTEPSTTYYTWSASDHHVSEPRQSNKQLSQRAAQEQGDGYISCVSVKDNSHTQNTLEYKAEGILSQNTSPVGIFRGEPPRKAQSYLTLEDLHHLADSRATEKPVEHVSKINIDAVLAKDSLNNEENKTGAAFPSEHDSRPSQAVDGGKHPTTAAIGKGMSAPIESSGCPRTEKTNSVQDIEAVNSKPQDIEQHPLNAVARNKQPIETTQPQITQAHRIRLNSNCGTLPSMKDIEPSNACATQFLGVGACRSLYWTQSMMDKAHECFPEPSMTDDCPPEIELDETKLDDYRVDFSGLDAFDREVLETGMLNQTVQTEDNLDSYSHHRLSFLPSTALGMEEGVPVLLSHDDSPCLSDAALFPDPLADQQDIRLPITGKTNHHATNVLTHTESKYDGTIPTPGLVPSFFVENQEYMRGSLGRHGRSTPVNTNPDPENWASSSRQRWNGFGGRGRIREGSREDVSSKTATLNERQKDAVGGDGFGPAAFWRPNRLY